MVSLTIQQRDLLYELLNTSAPVAVADIAGQMNLTPRQVNYSETTNWGRGGSDF